MQQFALPITAKTSLPPLISQTHNVQTKIHLQKPLISAKWGKRRSGSQRSRKLILDSIAFVASNLKILPEPLDSLVRGFCVGAGGNGGKLGFKYGFGGGGGGGGEGRSRRREKLGFWVLLMISSSLALWVVLERERESDLFWVLLIVSAFAVYFLVKGWRRETKDWVLGFCCGTVFMGLGLRNNENLVRWVHKIGANSPFFRVTAKKRRKGRRWM